MKLKKVINLFHFFCDVELFYADSDIPVYKGSIISLQAVMSDDKEECERYMRECIEDGDFAVVEEIKTAKRFENSKIDKSGIPKWYPVDIKCESNSFGVTRPILQITIKKV